MQNDPVLNGLSNNENLDTWIKAGFRFGDKGTHTSRTMMLEELTLLFQECTNKTSKEAYLDAIIEQNCLGKQTVATRKLSGQRLSELYGLDPSILLFRVLRYCWEADMEGRPLLALLTALARDPLLRITSTPILNMTPGEELARQQIKDALTESVRGRFNESTLDKVVRNASSSWTQAGHLQGRGRKIRRIVSPTPIVTAYAILLGFILGNRSYGLFITLWAKVLDTSQEELIDLAFDAKRLGFLDMSQAGGVIDVSVTRMLTEEERRLIYE
jgi:hypothetical protein